jgi:hypothetical protein
MKIFTSIAPRNIDRQKLAVESWIKAGFKPVSLNRAAEIDLLSAQFPQVEFILTTRDSTATTGKPLVFADDLFAAISRTGGGVSGLVNSDIIFRSPLNLPELFGEKAAGGLVFGSRTDIDQARETSGELFRNGYDFFFMDAKTARVYPPTSLSLGAPMWDYWAALVPMLKGLDCYLMNAMCAWHVRHEQHWDKLLNIRMMKEILEYSGIEFEGISGIDFSTENDGSSRILRQFGHFIVPYLEANSRLMF